LIFLKEMTQNKCCDPGETTEIPNEAPCAVVVLLVYNAITGRFRA